MLLELQELEPKPQPWQRAVMVKLVLLLPAQLVVIQAQFLLMSKHFSQVSLIHHQN